ncbi:MAG TPA: DUF3618 domain-containing protein [Lacunisphaera sp.]|nr:DUF3618 domain-containing protein [Lacunisphaera sp.]
MNTCKTPYRDPAAIRREIEATRRRMDDTIQAIGQRFQGRHLVDEALHLIRIQQENGNMTQLRNKLSDSADSAYHAVVDTVKAHPVPTALVGAGLAWLIFEKTRARRDNGEHENDVYRSGFYGDNFGSTSPSFHDDNPDREEMFSSSEPGVMQDVRQKAGEVVENLKTGAAHLRERTRQVTQSAGERARNISRQAGQQTQELYRRGRERVVSTVVTHPLESGLVCLAVGFLAGLALPTSTRLRHAVAPGAQALRARAQDVMERGKRVVRSAADAAKEEAETQGLTGKGRPGGRSAPDSDAGSAGDVAATPQATGVGASGI